MRARPQEGEGIGGARAYGSASRWVTALKTSAAIAAGARSAVLAHHFTDGGSGATDLAEAVWAAADEGAPDFRLLYPDDAPLADILAVIRRHKYSRYPVWDSHKGEFIGLLHIKDLLLALSALDSLPETFDLDELVRRTEQLVADPALTGRMGEAAARRAERYGPVAFRARLLALVDEISA